MVDRFTYLGSMVAENGGTERDIVPRLSKARAAFYTLTPVCSSKVFSTKTKVSLYNSNVKYVLPYGAENWTMNKKGNRILNTFQNRCLRRE